MLVPLDIPPGVYRNGTQYQSKGRWYDSNLIRFVQGTIQPVGGWQKVTTSTVAGTCRAALAWTSSSGATRLALGTTTKLYAYDSGVLVDITPAGLAAGATNAGLIGYGAGAYSGGFYGMPYTGSTLLYSPADTWSLDLWGEYLVGCLTSDGKIYEWQLNTANDAAVITNAPTNCSAVLVTDERIMVAFGAGGDPRKIQWSDQENNTVWTATATNTAGDKLLNTEGFFVTARKMQGQVLVLTNVDAHAMKYVGRPFVYGVDRVGDSCGCVGANAAASISTAVVWMSVSGFFIYDGYVKPLPCEVQDFILGDLNIDQRSKVYASHVSGFGEVWWYYPSNESLEINKYVVWNYRENHWTVGSLSRTAFIDRGALPYPVGVTSTGTIYYHEIGYNGDGIPLGSTRYLESGPIEIGAGERIVHVKQLLADEVPESTFLQMRATTRFAPDMTADFDHGPYTFNQNGYTDTRFTGRQAMLKFEGLLDGNWRLGKMRLDVTPGGKR